MDILEPLNLSYRDTHDIGLDLRRRIRELRENLPLLTPNDSVKEQLIVNTLFAAALDKPRLTGVAKAYLQLTILKRKKMDPFTASCVKQFLDQAQPRTHVGILLKITKHIIEAAPKKRKLLSHLSEEQLRQIIVREAIEAKKRYTTTSA